ncbi:MAG: ABC transporter ATP-binding protein, partial [Defluviitaleaceae bacterium]|nr:ABC transporter ATP-binding protein [Defluviitaleaceae bacterium]
VTIQAQVMKLIGDLREELGTSMILITHDMGIVATHCDYVAVVYAGSIVESGTKQQIFDHPAHPYTIGLFGAIPNMNVDDEWLRSIEGLPPDPSSLPPGCPFNPRCEYATDECRGEKIEMHITPDGHQCRCIHIDAVLKGSGAR